MPTLFPLRPSAPQEPSTASGVRQQRFAVTPVQGPTAPLTGGDRVALAGQLKAMNELAPDRATARHDLPSPEVRGVREAKVRHERRDHLQATLQRDDKTFYSTLRTREKLENALKRIGR